MPKMALVFLVITIMTTITKSTSASKPTTFLYTVCPNTTATFANHSQYQTNLNTIFESLSSNSSTSTGFHATSAGNTTKDAVYGLFLCRGDQNATSCKACVNTATIIDLPERCPNKKVGYIRYDECIVRYSNESFFGRMEKVPRKRVMNIQNITGNLSQFEETMVNMLNSTAAKAANGGSKKKYAIDIVPYTSLQTIYGLAQCTPDLTSRDCFQCLSVAIKTIPLSIGAQTWQPSCSVRYENYPFWNGAFISSLPPRAPPPTNNTNAALGLPSGGKKTMKKVIVAAAVPVAALLVALLAIGMYFKNKKAKKYDSETIFEIGENSTTFESLQYEFAVLQCATNYFSDENKLGEGGFGGVYKGKLSNGQIIAVKRLSKSSG